MVFCAIHRPTSVATSVPVGLSACARLSFGGTGASPWLTPRFHLGSSETTPDRRRPRAPTVVPRPPRRLPCVGHATYGSVLVLYRHLEPGRLYEALHSMRRVCSCNNAM